MRSLIHYKVGTAATSVDVSRKLAETWHLHFCSDRDCRLVYECAAHECPDVAKNTRCPLCRGQIRPAWVSARDPQECCLGNCTQVTRPDELIRYRLAGPGPWFQCDTCARSHGWPCT